MSLYMNDSHTKQQPVMIRKTHKLYLKDTSEAEMAKIAQLIAEIDAINKQYKSTNEGMNKIATEITSKNSTIDVVLEWIKENLGNSSVNLTPDTFPSLGNRQMLVSDKAGKPIIFYRYQIEAVINLKKLGFKVVFQDSTAQAFLLTIHDVNSNKTFVFETVFFEALLAVIKEICYDIDAFKNEIVAQYKTQYLAVKSDKEKLNKLFKVIPDFVLSAVLETNSLYEEIKFGWPDYLDEGESILNILQGLRYEDEDAFYCFMQKHPFTVMQIYNMLSGTDRANYVSLMAAISEKRAKKPNQKQFTVLPDGWWWDTHEMKASWNSNGTIKITGISQQSSNFIKRLVNSVPSMGPSQEANSILKQPPRPGTNRALEEYIKPTFITPPFARNPLDFIGIKTLAGASDDEILTYETHQIALTAKYIADELDSKVFWEVINILTSVMGIAGAVRVLSIKGGGWLLKTAAGIEIAKEVLELAMLSKRAKEALTEAGLGALVENWTTISITTDLAFLSLDGILSLAKNGKKGVNVLEEIKHEDQAKLLDEKTEQAYDILEEKTGIDVRNMSEAEFDEFINNNEALKDSRRMVENTVEAKYNKDVIENKFSKEKLPVDGKITKHTIDDKGLVRRSDGHLMNNGEYNFVITKENKLILGERHHLLGNRKNVKAAGSLVINKGRITQIDNMSGHYKPTLEESLKYPKVFKEANIKIRRAHLKIYEFNQNSKGYIIGEEKLVKTIEVKTLK